VPSPTLKKSKKRRLFLDFLILEDGTDTLPETSVKDYNSTLYYIPEERRYQRHGASLRSWVVWYKFTNVPEELTARFLYSEDGVGSLYYSHRAFSLSTKNAN
jgi:hypothetical protein